MEGSLYNTPPCWSIYVCGLVFKHLLGCGGLEGVKANNDAKAKLVYDAIEASGGFYSSPVEPSVRSNMNIPFTIPADAALEKEFLSESSKKNMVGIFSAFLPGFTSAGITIILSMPPAYLMAGISRMAAIQAYADAAVLLQVQLKGHRSVGGMRASVYNSMPLEGAKALAAFMKVCQANSSFPCACTLL